MNISHDEFLKLDLRVAKIVAAERVEGSKKILRLEVDLGLSTSSGQVESRQVVAGVGRVYNPEDLIGRQIIILANLEPRTFVGVESQGMLLAADTPDGPIILIPEKPVAPGTRIK